MCITIDYRWKVNSNKCVVENFPFREGFFGHVTVEKAQMNIIIINDSWIPFISGMLAHCHGLVGHWNRTEPMLIILLTAVLLLLWGDNMSAGKSARRWLFLIGPTYPEPSKGWPWPPSASCLCPSPPARRAASSRTPCAPPASARSTSCLALQGGRNKVFKVSLGTISVFLLCLR